MLALNEIVEQLMEEGVSEDADPIGSKRPRKSRSRVWNDFKMVYVGNKVKAAVCNHCKSQLTAGSNGGTSHLARHLTKCPRNILLNEKPRPLPCAWPAAAGKANSLKDWAFDREIIRSKLARMVQLEGLKSKNCKRAPIFLAKKPVRPPLSSSPLAKNSSMAAEVKEHNEPSNPFVDEDSMLDSPESVRSDDDTILTTKKKLHRKYQNVTKKCGVCYLSRVPPHMDPTKLRQILSRYGDIQRIYLVAEDPTAQMYRKRAGGFRGKQFNEGWVEFTEKRTAKKIANLLNGEQIGGKKRSSFYYDIWNIRYLSKFTWDDLTNEIAEKNHIREQKRALETSAAKRERDFYLSKVEQSRALSSIEERINKKQKTGEIEVSKKEPKVIRHFRQNQPISADTAQKKQKLSKDILAGLLGVGS